MKNIVETSYSLFVIDSKRITSWTVKTLHTNTIVLDAFMKIFKVKQVFLNVLYNYKVLFDLHFKCAYLLDNEDYLYSCDSSNKVTSWTTKILHTYTIVLDAFMNFFRVKQIFLNVLKKLSCHIITKFHFISILKVHIY